MVSDPVVCAGACYDMAETMEYAPYNTGAKYCSDCKIYLFTNSIISHYDTLKDDLLTLDEVIVGRIFHT
jgi:hypothetical protein